MNSRKSLPANKPSTLLSREENDILSKILGTRCQALSTAVVQVFGTDGPHHNMWRKRHCGAVTFTKDNVRRSYYIQVYDVIGGALVFEQELYNQFIYNVSKPFFHQFEAEEQMIGLNFADEREASQFNQAVNERLAAKQRKKEERKRQSEHQQRIQPHVPQEQPRPPPATFNTTQFIPPKDNKKKNNKKGSKNKSKLSKEQIGMPMDFKHITHVGFDPDKGLTQFNVDDKLEGFFKMVGVSEQQLSDHRTREFIYDFIEKNGGVEKAMQETQRFISQPPPSPPPPNSTMSHHAPPPPPPINTVSPPTPPNVPSRTPSTRAAPPPPPRNIHHAPPPPPPNSAPPPPPLNPRAPMPPPPGQVVAGQKKTPLPPPPPAASIIPPPPPPTSTIPTWSHNSSTRAAPPPPPPMAPQAPSAPRPPPPPPEGMPAPPAAPVTPRPPGPPAVPDVRTALMDQIRMGGSNLKKVEPIVKAPITDSRSLLMNQIRGGIQLKNVVKEPGDGDEDDQQLEGMAFQLNRALLARAHAIQSESDDDDEEEDDDDDWDDDDP